MSNRKLHIHELTEKVDIGDEKVDIQVEKVDIENKNVDIEQLLFGKTKEFSTKTIIYIYR